MSAEVGEVVRSKSAAAAGGVEATALYLEWAVTEAGVYSEGVAEARWISAPWGGAEGEQTSPEKAVEGEQVRGLGAPAVRCVGQ